MSGTPPCSVVGGVASSAVADGMPQGVPMAPISEASSAMGLGCSSSASGPIVPGSVADHFCLRWNNYQTNMTTVFDQLLQEEVFVDVTLSCEGGAQLRAHKVVLAACSPYFQSVLQHNPCKHPIIIMPRDVVFVDLRAIIDFVYRGEIDVAQEQINSLLQAAEILKIKGLCEVSDDPSSIPPGFTATPTSRSTPTTTSSVNISTTNSVNHSSGQSRGRPPLNRGRYSYRPRGRPPLYGRHRYERPAVGSRPLPNSIRDQQPGKRIKTEMIEEDNNISLGNNSNNLSSIRVSCVSSSGGSAQASMSGGDIHRGTHHYMQQTDQHLNGIGGQAVQLPLQNSNSSTVPLLPLNHTTTSHLHHVSGGGSSTIHPPPPPLPELGPSVPLLTDDNSSGVSHATTESDYDAYYVKTEEHQQHQPHMNTNVSQHLQAAPPPPPPSDLNDPSGVSQRMTVTPELLGMMPGATAQYTSDAENLTGNPSGRKLWTDEDMDKALDSLRNAQMSLSKAAQVFGIPATTLWQRAHRMGIETPKKEGANKTWSEHDLAGALEELRSGRLSANRASKEFGIPNSTLYKIARKEGIKLSSPFSAIQPSWNPEDLNRALDSIRGGMSVQKAAQEYGIPTGTLYGRCRREGIELSKYQGVPWSEEDMKDALEVVRVGEMSINQAAIHYNLPYSSLYGRFKRGKYEDGLSHQDFLQQEMTIEHYSNDQMSLANTMQQQQSGLNSQHVTPPPSVSMNTSSVSGQTY